MIIMMMNFLVPITPIFFFFCCFFLICLITSTLCDLVSSRVLIYYYQIDITRSSSKEAVQQKKSRLQEEEQEQNQGPRHAIEKSCCLSILSSRICLHNSFYGSRTPSPAEDRLMSKKKRSTRGYREREIPLVGEVDGWMDGYV